MGAMLLIASAAAWSVGRASPGVPVASAQPASAWAELRDTSGLIVGTATFTEDSDGVWLSVEAWGLSPGLHGIHVHQVGQCDAPDFMSAGEHFNPDAREHGLLNAMGPHAGDLPTLDIDADGTASYEALDDLVTLQGGPMSLFDMDGSALVIHADPDDQMTSPSGGSGSRIACGVIVPSM